MATIAAPPWEDTKFNVKKAPPKVPKPASLPKRIVPTVPASPSSAGQQRQSPQPRWGQLGPTPSSVASTNDEFPQAPDSSIPLKTEMFSDPGALMSAMLHSEKDSPTNKGKESQDSLPLEGSDSHGGVGPDHSRGSGGGCADCQTASTSSAPSTPNSKYQNKWKQLNEMPTSFEEKLQRLRKPNIEKAPTNTNPSQEALAFFEELIAGPCPSNGKFPGGKTETNNKDDEPVSLQAHLNEASKRLQAQAEEARKRRESAQAQAEEAQKQREKADSTTKPQSPAAARYKKFLDGKVDATNSRDSQHAKSETPEDMKRKHEEKLAAMEQELEEERRRFAEDMERTRAEEERRAKEQEEWRNRLKTQTEVRKRQAREEMEAKQAQKEQAERKWKQDWWAHWKKTEERAKSKSEEHAKWSQEFWANFNPTEEEKADFDRWTREQMDADAKEDDFWNDFEKRWQERTRNSASYKRRPSSAFGHADRGEQCLTPGKKPTGESERAVWEKVRQAMSLSHDERKRVWKELCLQWHPDKCADQMRAKEVFQYLQSLKDWLLPDKPCS